MDDSLCDELVQEIFLKLPSNSSLSSIPLVSKRWLSLYRTSKASLSLRLSLQSPTTTLQSLSTFLSHYPSLSSLSLTTTTTSTTTTTNFSDQVLLLVSSLCPRLLSLRFMAVPVSLSSLVSLSRTSNNLTSLSICLSRPLVLNWLINFGSLKELSISISKSEALDRGLETEVNPENDDPVPELGIETLCLSGIRNDDWGFSWLWKSCSKKLRKLRLLSCEGIGDGGSFSSFVACFSRLQEIEMRTCRTIVDGVLMKLAESCESLESLLVYDGGSREGLIRFFTQCGSRVRNLDLRLPLDLDNDHLLAISSNFGATLLRIRLQSCCLVNGEGLKALGFAARSGLEELALINCNAVEREPGLLAALGQSLRKLRRLDLSYNETLVDKELVSMLVSCRGLVDLKLRGCKRLTGLSLVSMTKSCDGLESVDVTHCVGIETEAVEFFLVNSPRLRRVQVEEGKVSEAARNWASMKFIEVV